MIQTIKQGIAKANIYSNKVITKAKLAYLGTEEAVWAHKETVNRSHCQKIKIKQLSSVLQHITQDDLTTAYYYAGPA
ncbi:hypothetical protein DSUL_50374 [Desulfovibrionales bacterium]